MKIARTLLYFFIGGLIGGMLGLTFSYIGEHSLIDTLQFSTHKLILWTSMIGVLINIILTFYLLALRKHALSYRRKVESGKNEENIDDYDKKANQKYTRASLIVHVQTLISFIVLIIVVTGHGHDSYALIAFLPFVFTVIPNWIFALFARKYDSRLPKLGEKNTVKKTLNAMDDGERYITLESMFYIFNINIFLLSISTIGLAFFSIVTGSNQFLGLFILTVLFAVNGIGYLLKVNKLYQL